MATERYIEAVGRRKTATARVRITPAKKTTFVVNEKEMDVYFPTTQLQKVVNDAIAKIEGVNLESRGSQPPVNPNEVKPLSETKTKRSLDYPGKRTQAVQFSITR